MERTNKTAIAVLSVVIAISVLINLLQAFIEPSEAEQFNNCREVMMNKALGDEYVDHVLDSVANARADSIVEHRMYLLMPEPE
jgi:hypothetical protein